MAGDAFEYEDEERGIGTAGFGSGGKVGYASTGGTTPNRGGGSFTNVGQLLSLNRKSGQESARSLNSGIADQAGKAKQGLESAEKTFNADVDKAAGVIAPDATREQATAALGQGPYAGPNRIDDTKDFGKVRSDIQSASDRVNNLKTADGRAAEAAKAQSLGGRQASASAFYMGNSNPMFGATVQRFGNLTQMMGDAAGRAQNYAGAGSMGMDANKKAAQNRLGQLDARDATNARNAEMARRQQAEAQYLRERSQANASGGVSGRTNMSEQEIASTMGLPYEVWLAAGKPYDQNDSKYKKALADYQASQRTGGL